jgi:zinc protease
MGMVGLAAAQTPATQATTAPDAPQVGAELLQDKSQMPGYGIESYRIVSEPDEIVSVLRNGAVVICKRVASPVAAVRGYCETGGVYEGKWLGGGLSHLLEHLVAGGSSQRRTEAQNRDILQKIGNDSNAYTTFDHTAFFVNTTTPHFAEAVDLVTGWMLGALITEPEYRREYEVVQRELERNKSNPDMVFWLLTQSNRYQVNPARVPVIGYQEVIQGLKRDDVYSYYQLAYQPNNMIFSVAADMDPEEMLAILQRNLADAKPGRVFSHDIAAEPPVMSPRTIVATFPGLGQARLQIAFPSVKQSDPDMYAMDLLAQILGGGESSILSEQVRDQQQLCSTIACDDDTPSYADGTFAIELQLDTPNVSTATAAILLEIEKIKANGVDADRLARAKSQIKIQRLKDMQTSQDVAASLALDYMTSGNTHFNDLYVQRIEQISAQQVQDAAKKYLDQQKLLTTLLLPREDVGAAGLPKAEDLIRAQALGASGATTQPAEVAQESSPVTRTVLDNGVILLHRQITTTPLVSISMFALGGVSAEDVSNNGISDLAMSLLRRGTANRSAQQIANFFDLTGGDLQAVCGNNSWYWTVSCTQDDFPKTMDVFADVVNHPVFAPDQVNLVKTRVQAAIDSEDAAWDAQAFRFFKQKFFGPKNSPYQFEPIGSKENVAKFTADDVRKWYGGKILTAPRVIAIYGDVDQATAIAMAKQYFGQGPQLPAPPKAMPALFYFIPDAPPQPPAIEVDRVEVKKTDQELAGVVIGFESNSVVGEGYEPVLTVSQCLTGGYGYPTGYIFEILRGQGLVYEAATINNPGRSQQIPGAFLAYAGCGPENVNKVVDVILENMARLQGSPQDIQTDWFTRCKSMITTSEALQTELPEDQAQIDAINELFGLGYQYHDGFDFRINRVVLPEVRWMAATRLKHCVVTICTPRPDLVKVSAGERNYSSFPTVDLTPRGVQHAVPH